MARPVAQVAAADVGKGCDSWSLANERRDQTRRERELIQKKAKVDLDERLERSRKEVDGARGEPEEIFHEI